MTRNTDSLWYARATIADAPHHDDQTVLFACEIILAQATDEAELMRARALAHLILSEAA